jgi:polar amino acid transport system substrate-binding protein
VRSIPLSSLFSLCVALLLGTALPAHAGKVLDRVVKSDTLRVGMSGDQPPMNVLARGGATIGLEPDLAKVIALGMGVRLEIVSLPFGELESALRRGRVDMVMSGMSITPERARRMAFVGPYLLSGKSLLTRAGALADADGTGDLDDPRVRIAVLANSTSESFVKEYAPNAAVVPVATYDEGVRRIIAGEAAAMVADMPACSFAVLRNPDAGLIALTEPLKIEPIAIAVDARDAEFRNLLQNYLDSIEGSGVERALKDKWFRSGDWLRLLP